MKELGIKSWGLVPVDSDPASGIPSTTHPPMVATLALDPGASLVLELEAPPTELELQIRLTALSAEGETGEGMKLMSAASEGLFSSLDAVSWDKDFEGMDALFTARILNAGAQIKLHSQASRALIIRTVALGAP